MKKMLIVLLFFMPFCQPSAKNTSLKYYRAFGEAVDQVPLVVKQEKKGQCMGQSQKIVREDAWRCEADGEWLDPCFSNTFGNMQVVLCPQSPWDGSSIKLILSSPLNAQSNIALDMSKAYPWAIELANSEKCLAEITSETFDNLPIRYRCSGGLELLGHVQRCSPRWKMLMRSDRGVELVTLEKAWF